MRRRILDVVKSDRYYYNPYRDSASNIIMKVNTSVGELKEKPRVVIDVDPLRTAVRSVYLSPLIDRLKQIMPAMCYSLTYDEVNAKYTELIEMGWSSVYYTDFSQFELSQSEETFEVEKMVYEYFGLPQALVASIYSSECFWQVRKRYGFPCAFRCEGIRQSGDPQTSFGNNLLAIFVHTYVCSRTCSHFSIMNNGDDAILFCSGPIDFSLYSALGFKITVNKRPEYCRSVALDDVQGYRFMRLPWEFFGRIGFSVRASGLSAYKKRQLLAVNCLGYSHVVYGLPLYQALIHTLFRLCCVTVEELDLEQIESYTVRNWLRGSKPIIHPAVPPSITIRNSFDDMFNFPIHEQLALEKLIEQQTDINFTLVHPALIRLMEVDN